MINYDTNIYDNFFKNHNKNEQTNFKQKLNQHIKDGNKIKYITKNLDCRFIKTVPITIDIKIMMGSVPIAIKPPIKVPTKPILARIPTAKNRKYRI